MVAGLVHRNGSRTGRGNGDWEPAVMQLTEAAESMVLSGGLAITIR